MTYRDLATPFSTFPLLLLLLLLFLLHALFHTLFLFLFSCPRTADTVAFLECTSEDHAWCKAILVAKILYLIHQFQAMMLRRFTVRKGIFKWIQHFGVKGVSSGCSWQYIFCLSSHSFRRSCWQRMGQTSANPASICHLIHAMRRDAVESGNLQVSQRFCEVKAETGQLHHLLLRLLRLFRLLRLLWLLWLGLLLRP